VVSLYIAVLVPMLAVVHAMPNTSIATNEYITQLVQVRHTPVAEPETIVGTPARLIIPRLGIDLPIEAGTYDAVSDSWTLSRTAVHYAVMTALPNNDSGNTLIYGHNNRKILAPTRDIQVGDELHIITKENQTFTYRYVADVKVDPANTDILTAAAGNPKLTLLTCNGLWNEKRRLMDFEYTGVSW
jgi:LPXTG-site transpeptidase (sortase) family protein